MSIKQKFAAFVGVAVGGLASLNASATTLIDATMSTALDSGFTDLKDTVIDLVGTAWPYVIGITAVLIAPRLVKRLMKSIG
jgi:hypothetical protein